MDSELFYNTPIFSDDTTCPNENCVDGMVAVPVWNNDDECFDHDTEKCRICHGLIPIEDKP